jgi:two-component system sensor histidine kinase KdpD
VTISANDGEGVLLTVHDDGPGVAPGQEEAIFERFVRSGGDDRAGSGLGLAIVKGFADAMQMPVSVQNAPAGGAVFTLVLERA